jgi:hypothetical protein
LGGAWGRQDSDGGNLKGQIMAIVDPADFPIDPDLVDGTQLSEILNRLTLVIHSNNANATRPPEITAGGIWTKYTAPSTYQVLMFNGVSDVTLTVAGLAKGTSLANPFDGAVNYAKGALIWQASTETLLSAKYAIPSGGAFNAGDWNANAKVEGSFLHLDGGTVVGPVLFSGAVDFSSTLKLSTLTPSRALGINSSGNLAASSATVTELSYLSGVSSAIQPQIDTKQDTITGAASTIVTANLNASAVVTTTTGGKITSTTGVTVTELGYLDGVTSNIQSQLNGKADSSDAWPGVYTGSTHNNTSFPIGTTIHWQNFGSITPVLNGTVAPYVASDQQIYGTNNVAFSDTRSLVSGTWRFRGGGMLQRTA